MHSYVHGYSEQEAIRLKDQAGTLAKLIHYDSLWQEDSLILEAGCGVGAQTQTVAPQNPDCQFISVDISHESISEAQKMAEERGIRNVNFQQANIFELPFPKAHFDHVFVCFVLEHLPDPQRAFRKLLDVLKPGGTLT